MTMDFSLLEGGENNPLYQERAAGNTDRYYSFLLSTVDTAIKEGSTWLSESLIKAFNFHAIVGLHYEAGQYRTRDFGRPIGNHVPPLHQIVPSLMDDFVNRVNWMWTKSDPIGLAAYALWRINYIHPFVNGNGRTARAVCYYVLCGKFGALLPGNTIVPALMSQGDGRSRYVDALSMADQGDIKPLTDLAQELLTIQLES